MKFALMMEKVKIEGTENYQVHMKSQNTGIPDPEVLLFVKCWVEKMEDKMKENIKASINYS